MRRPSRRLLPKIIGVSLAATVVADVGLILTRPSGAAGPTPERFVAASEVARVSPTAVAPLKRRYNADILIAGPRTLPASVVDRIRGIKGVAGVEIVDAAQAMVAGKRVGLLGVEPSTFRSYTPKPTAGSDALWRNIYAGDVAVSFVFGSVGGVVKLGSTVPVGGKQRQSPLRVGAYATMGMSQVDAVVSHTSARALGVPSGNALVVSAPEIKSAKLRSYLTKVLPKDVKAAEIHPEPRLTGNAPRQGRVSGGRLGQVMSAQQIAVAIRAAESRLGWPYVWGGESEAEGGYDCSGLLQYAFAQAGIRLPRVAADQARTGWRIPFQQARPGDLLIWANDPTAPGYVSHIALYVGDGRMLVAPHTGAVVRFQQVYFTNMLGAVRVNPLAAGRLA